MAVACRVVTADADSIYPVGLGRMSPGETDVYEHDLSADADCAGAGVTISNVVPAINPDDDDGLLTLGTTVIDGLTFRQFMTADADTTQRNYMITFTITLSDTRLLKRSQSFPVLPTRAMNA